jgi:hypothetical protein
LKIDIVGVHPFAPQCKVITGKHHQLVNILESIVVADGEIPVLHLKVRRKKGDRFLTVGKLAILFDKDFFKLARNYEDDPIEIEGSIERDD